MGDDKPVVKTVEGSVRGEKLESVRGGTYYSFKGIPYAKPPVGDLRFKAPKPVEPWTGVKDAFKEGAPAPSLNMITHELLEESNEDCLFINVYTPQLPGKSNELKPVMFWVHGGGFCMGSGNTDLYGPDYLITEDVLLVTFNYRLGILGFLNLGIPECSGNYGLKDMVAALKWVQRNISAFGGDPNNVTIFGESAGGAAVQYLLISKLTKGLFHKAISQSGATINPWAFCEDPKKVALVVAESLGCKSTKPDEVLAFFKTVDPHTLVEREIASRKLAAPEEHFLTLHFVPSIEPDFEGAFITEHPREILKRGDLHDVPYMTGVTTLEGLIIVKQEAEPKEYKVDEDYEAMIPFDMKVKHGTEKSKEIAKKIRNYYFPNGYDYNKLIDLLSHAYFTNGINKVIDCLTQLPKRSSPTYLYQFSYDGGKGYIKAYLKSGDLKGTSHGDELGYLFSSTLFKSQFTPGSPDDLVVEKITKLWTDFAKYGNPTPKDNRWPPLKSNKLVYLDIGEDLSLRQDLEKESSKFWYDLYKSACTRMK